MPNYSKALFNQLFSWVYSHLRVCPAGGQRANQGGEGSGQIPPVQLPHQVHKHDGPPSRLFYWLVLSCGMWGNRKKTPRHWGKCESGFDCQTPVYFWHRKLNLCVFCFFWQTLCCCCNFFEKNISSSAPFANLTFLLCICPLLLDGTIYSSVFFQHKLTSCFSYPQVAKEITYYRFKL